MTDCNPPRKTKRYGLSPTRVKPVVYANDEIRPANPGDLIDTCYLPPPTMTWQRINECSGLLVINGSSLIINFCDGPPPGECNILRTCAGDLLLGYIAPVGFANAVAMRDCDDNLIGYVSPVSVSGSVALRNCGTGEVLGYVKTDDCDYPDIPTSDLCETVRDCSDGYITRLGVAGINAVRNCNGDVLGWLDVNMRDCEGNQWISGCTDVSPPSGCDITVYSGCTPSPSLDSFCVSPSPVGGDVMRDCTGAVIGHLWSAPIPGGNTIRQCDGTLLGYAASVA